MSTKHEENGKPVKTKAVSETGHLNNAANFQRLLLVLADLGDIYVPANPHITWAGLQDKKLALSQAFDAWMTARQAFNVVENNRTGLFAGLNAYSTRIINMLASSAGVATLTLKDARSVINRIQGIRSAAGKKKLREQQEAAPGTQTHTISISHLSYSSRADNFTGLRKLVELQPGYQPVEPQLSLAGIREYEGQLMKANKQITAAMNKLIDARNARNEQLYDEATGVIALSKKIKAYVKGLYGSRHERYRRINSIPFKTLRHKLGSLT